MKMEKKNMKRSMSFAVLSSEKRGSNVKRLSGLLLIIILGSTTSGFVVSTESTQESVNSSVFLNDAGVLLGLEPEFHTYPEVVSELAQIESEHPFIAEVFLLGRSYEKRDILGIKISDNVSTDESEPEALICALHHAREAATVEVAMYIINYLTDNYGNPGYDHITSLVDNREIYIIPIVNPDGKVFDDSGGPYGQGLYWRKNRQPCSGGFGIDLNRNYSYEWGGVNSSPCCAHSNLFRGYSPFDAPETAAVRDFVLAHPDITVFLDYHSFGGMVLWPWGYTADPISDLDDRQVHEIIGQEYAQITGYNPMDVSELYTCSGIGIDWTYGTTQNHDIPIFSWTIELSGAQYPSGDGFYPSPLKLPTICEENCEAALYVLECADNPYKVLRQWKVSDLTSDCAPDSDGDFWYKINYNDSHWEPVTLPDCSTEYRGGHLFYRHTFTVYYETQQVLVDFPRNEGITIYVNEQCIGQWDNCRDQGCADKDYSASNFPLDITDYVLEGENLIAVRFSKDSSESVFDMNIAQSTELYDEKTWKASDPVSDCYNPDNGDLWYKIGYNDSHWGCITLPDTSWGCTFCDRFYRRTFTVPEYTRVLIDFSSCDSITIYVNEELVGQWGDCHEEGGVNADESQCSSVDVDPVDITDYVLRGENLIAVHVSSSTTSFFDMTLIRPKILPDLRITNHDITFSTPCPKPKEKITIYATVHNTGPNVRGALLRFYDGNPRTGTLIKEFPVDVKAASASTFETTWVYPGGTHDIYVVIDEINKIPETNREKNNTGHALIPVPDFHTWPMFRHDSYHSGVSQLTGDITTPVERWKFSAGGPVRSSPSVEDIDNDGRLEIVFGSDDHYLYAVTCTGHLLWKFKTGDCIVSSPAICDIDNDGKPEIVFGSDDGHVYALNGDGSLLWKYFTGGKVDSSPLIYDIDDDRKMEIFVGSHSSMVYGLNGEDGSLLWTFGTGGVTSASPVLLDIDGRGTLRVVIGSDDSRLYSLLPQSGTLKGRFAACARFSSSPAVGDINGDGRPEIVAGNDDDNVHALTNSGGYFWSFTAGCDINSSPAIADIDQNGDIEIIFGSEEGEIYALNGEDGSVLWSYQTKSVISSPAVGDIDGDGGYDVIIGSANGYLLAICGTDGLLLWKFQTGARIESSPAIADIDNDGKAEVIFGSNDGNIYVLGSNSLMCQQVGVLVVIIVMLGVLLLGRFLLKRN